MHLLKVTTFALLFASFSFSAPIAIAYGSIDFSNMVTTFSFEGTPGIEVSDYSFLRSMAVYQDDLSRQSFGTTEGDFFLSLPAALATQTVSSQNGYFYSHLLTPTINDSASTAATRLGFNRTFSVENLKEITIEYDLQAASLLFTEIGGDVAESTHDFFNQLNASGIGIIDREDYSYYLLARDGQDTTEFYNQHVELSYSFASPYTGTLQYVGFSRAITRAIVPENNSNSLIIPGLATTFCFVVYRRKKFMSNL